MRPKCPCQDCVDRTVTCHGFCKRYKEWKVLLEKEAEAKRIYNEKYGHPKRAKKIINHILKIK